MLVVAVVVDVVGLVLVVVVDVVGLVVELVVVEVVVAEVVVLVVGVVVVDEVVELAVLSSPPLASAITAITRPMTTAATRPIIAFCPPLMPP